MDLRRLRHFSELAETLNFRAAAERVHLTQPAFTRSIARLEQELGTQLFVRDKRSVELTPAGAALLGQVRTLLCDADALERAAKVMGQTGRRELHVGLYGTALAELTHPVLLTFAQRYPDVEVVVHDVAFDNGVEPLLRGELDVGLLRAPTDIPSISAVPLFAEPAAFQLPISHPLSREQAVYATDLLDDSWAGLPSTTPAEWGRYFVCADQHDGGAPSIGGEGRTITEVASLVALRGLVALVPNSTARQHHPGVSSVPALGVEPFRVAVLHAASTTDAAVQAFVDVAIEVTRQNVSMVPGAELLA